jgi:hypothetical protein
MKETEEDLIVRLHREEAERMRREGPLPQLAETPSIPHTDLPQAHPDSLLFVEWDTYRREVRRLLAEGKEGQFALIKGQQLVVMYATEREALDRAYRLFPCQLFLVHQVREREPLLQCISVRSCRG